MKANISITARGGPLITAIYTLVVVGSSALSNAPVFKFKHTGYAARISKSKDVLLQQQRHPLNKKDNNSIPHPRYRTHNLF
jgi:hypothetical protein